MPMLVVRIPMIVALSAGLLVILTGAARAQTVPVPLARVAAQLPEAPTPLRLLMKAGMRLTHLFYQPSGSGTWQFVLPSSFGVEYRLRPHLSLYAMAEADIMAGRAPRGGRNASLMLPTPTTDISLGARYYFTEATISEPWGNYIALEGTAGLSQLAVRGRGRQARPTARLTPGLFALCGTQHQGPGRRPLFDLNAGLGLQMPPPYAADAVARRPWDVAAQVNLRVFLVNQPHSPRHRRH